MSTGITPVSQITSITQAQKSQASRHKGAVSQDFGNMLGNAINGLAEKESTANNAIAQLAAGGNVDLHQVMLSMQEADIAFQVALQTRNKLVDAYKEIMRMQV